MLLLLPEPKVTVFHLNKLMAVCIQKRCMIAEKSFKFKPLIWKSDYNDLNTEELRKINEGIVKSCGYQTGMATCTKCFLSQSSSPLPPSETERRSKAESKYVSHEIILVTQHPWTTASWKTAIPSISLTHIPSRNLDIHITFHMHSKLF